MHDIQPPIVNDQELAGYIAGLERFNEIVAARESALFASQHDPQRLEEARQELYRVYRKRQGILDAIAAYQQRHHGQYTAWRYCLMWLACSTEAAPPHSPQGNRQHYGDNRATTSAGVNAGIDPWAKSATLRVIMRCIPDVCALAI